MYLCALSAKIVFKREGARDKNALELLGVLWCFRVLGGKGGDRVGTSGAVASENVEIMWLIFY